MPANGGKLGEEFARPEKLGLAPKVLQNLWGSAEPFFIGCTRRGSYSAKGRVSAF